MSFQLRQTETIATGIARAAGKQLKRAARDLHDLPDNAAVHSIRRRFKRVRALARLVRPWLGEQSYGRTNQAVRDAGKPLAELRDAEGLLRTVEQLSRSSQMPETEFEAIHQGLKANRIAVGGRFSADHSDKSIGDSLVKARKAVRDWTINARGWKAIRAGLTDTYRKTKQAFATALIDPSVANLHEWRKQTKYLWNETEFIKLLRPRAFGQLGAKLHQLGDLLGDDHDLAVLATTLEARQQEWNARGAAERLLPLVHERRERLQRRAIKLAEQVLGPEPKHFVPALKRKRRPATRAAIAS